MPTSSFQSLSLSQLPGNITVAEIGGSVDMQLLQELDQLLTTMASAQSPAAGLILHLAGDANTNWQEIIRLSHASEADLEAHCQTALAVLNRLSESPWPTVAIIDRACTGASLEVALWCDFRIGVEHDPDEPNELGFPQIELGLSPRWGGSVRLARISGLKIAANLLTTGQKMSVLQAQVVRLVDQVIAGDESEQARPMATRLLAEYANPERLDEHRSSRVGEVPDATQELKRLTPIAEAIAANGLVYPFAPTVLLEHATRTVFFPQHAALKSETAAVQQIWGSPANLGLLNHHLLTMHNSAQPGLVDLQLTPVDLETVGVIGAGLMGSSIAKHCVQQAKRVQILDANSTAAAAAVATILDEHQDAAIEHVDAYKSLGINDLVIESVVETLDVKKLVLEKLCDKTTAQTIIASNTSAIPIGQLAQYVSHPERFCGIHFCHPELMSLVEVICGPQTDEQTIANAVHFIRSLEKMPVAMNDGAGFVVNRLLSAMIDQAVRLLVSGIRIENIDLAMREFGFQGGPFEIIDVIGTDTCMYAGRTMWEAGLQCVSLSPVLPKLVKRGRLGRKSGAGFYQYDDPRGEPISDDQLTGLIEAYLSTELPPAGSSLNQSELESIRNQILAGVTREAFQIIEEEIVNDIRDIDLCIIHGFSFPKHWGGILFWADQFGISKVVEILDQIAATEPRLVPPEGLRKMAREGRKFYSPD